jgi:hypothetical protein
MPTTYKVLGQAKPTAATLTSLYTVPASTQTVASTLNISNLTNDLTTVRVAIRPAGAAIEDKNYLVYNNTVPGYGTAQFTIGITLGATDVVSVYDTAGKCAFNLFGSEIS